MIQSLDDLKEDYARLKALDVKIDDVVDHGLSLGIYLNYRLPNTSSNRSIIAFHERLSATAL